MAQMRSANLPPQQNVVLPHVSRGKNVTFPVLVCLHASFFWTVTISWFSIQCL